MRMLGRNRRPPLARFPCHPELNPERVAACTALLLHPASALAAAQLSIERQVGERQVGDEREHVQREEQPE